jgi:hypothetical protein
VHPSGIDYDFNDRCKRAYHAIIGLDFELGQQLLNQEKYQNPQNRIPTLLENYIDFLTLAIGEEQSDFERLKPGRQERINFLSSGNPGSPWHRHCLAAVYLQWSFVRVKFGEYVMAGLDMNRAFRLLSQNESIHPDFPPDLLLSGVTNALIGSIPDNYKWAARFVGMSGTIEAAREKFYQLLEIAEHKPEWEHLQSETFFYLAFIEMNLQNDKNLVEDLLARMEATDNLGNITLVCYLKANLSMRSAQNDKAIKMLEACSRTQASIPFLYNEFLLGTAKLNRLDQEAAAHFRNYVGNYKGSNYIKSAYQKLAWLALMRNDTREYQSYIALVLKNGKMFVDEDKQAQAEALSKRAPELVLLNARLLFDGGYYNAALDTLQDGKSKIDFSNTINATEYLYRKARIFHEMKQIEKAMDYYKQTIELGSSLPDFFAANASLQMGLIHENQKNYALAERYYNLCLKLPFTEYRISIQQKARAGIRRIEDR